MNNPEHPSLRFDKEGRWYHEGVEITHERTCKLFSRSLKKDTRGRYLIAIGKEWSYVEVEDAPFLVKSLDYYPSDKAEDAYFTILLNDGSTEALDLDTIRVGKDNVLYCQVKNGDYRGRFCRPSYYELARYIEFDPSSGGYYILLNGKRHYLEREGSRVQGFKGSREKKC
ncbi:MAG: DUF1285 domain-containing protein [Deltaproteobacteria bacterium]|nr:MAG: DUF1285 domain-containing protein [Deltaproteobacteria bacterium]